MARGVAGSLTAPDDAQVDLSEQERQHATDEKTKDLIVKLQKSLRSSLTLDRARDHVQPLSSLRTW